MRSLHDLRRARRNGIFDHASKLVNAARKLQRLPDSIQKIGDTADAINRSKLPQNLSNVSGEVAGTVRTIKYVAIGALALATGYVLTNRNRGA